MTTKIKIIADGGERIFATTGDQPRDELGGFVERRGYDSSAVDYEIIG